MSHPGKIKQTVDTSEGDREYMEKFQHQLDMLTGMIIEMVEENKALLLSPVLRELLVEKAKSVKEMFQPLKGRLVADNPGEDFPWK